MRGKLGMVSPYVVFGGLIPAHAGKTAAQMVQAIKSGAHPRACGENLRSYLNPCGYPGSSPRMRGKPARRARFVIALRLIPAHAGKT